MCVVLLLPIGGRELMTKYQEFTFSDQKPKSTDVIMLFDQHFQRYLNATHASFIFCNMRTWPNVWRICARDDKTSRPVCTRWCNYLHGRQFVLKLITGLLWFLLKAIWCSHTKITVPTASPAAIRHSAGVCPRCFLLSPLAISLSGQTIRGYHVSLCLSGIQWNTKPHQYADSSWFNTLACDEVQLSWSEQ